MLEVLAGGGANRNFSIAKQAILSPGRRYDVRFDYFAEIGAFSSTVYLGVGSSTGRFDSSGVEIEEGAWQADKRLSFVIPASDTLRLSPFTTAVGSAVPALALNAGKRIYFKRIRIWDLGPVFDLEADPNRGLRDRGANQLHGVRTNGTQYVGAKIDSFPGWRVTHGAAGALQFGGGTAIDTSKTWAMDTLLVRSTAAVTWSLGNVSGGKQYVADFALAVGDNYVTGANLITRLINGANLWSQSSGAAEISIFPVLRRTS